MSIMAGYSEHTFYTTADYLRKSFIFINQYIKFEFKYLMQNQIRFCSYSHATFFLFPYKVLFYVSTILGYIN